MRAVDAMVLGAALLGGVPGARAQVDLPPATKEVLKQFEEEAAELGKKAEADAAKRRGAIAAELQKVQDAYCKEAKLDEALAVRDHIRRLREGAGDAPVGDLPPAAREVYKNHAEDVAEIHKRAEAALAKRRSAAVTELQKVQDAYCKEAKLDEALAVRDLLRAVRDGVGNALPDPGYVNNGADDIGKVFYYQVTGTDRDQSIWGTDVFTTGSHLGMAAVHSGVLNAGQKGVVRVTILPAQTRYAATTRHGVTSYSYGPWGVSFKVERVYGYVGKLP